MQIPEAQFRKKHFRTVIFLCKIKDKILLILILFYNSNFNQFYN